MRNSGVHARHEVGDAVIALVAGGESEDVRSNSSAQGIVACTAKGYIGVDGPKQGVVARTPCQEDTTLPSRYGQEYRIHQIACWVKTLEESRLASVVVSCCSMVWTWS